MTETRPRSASEVLAEQLEDPTFRAHWERTALARAVAHRLVRYRVDHGLSQTQLGRVLCLPQSAVARLESGEHVPTIETLLRLSEALAIEFLLDIRPAAEATSWVSPTVERAKVVEQVTTGKGSSLFVAVS